MKNLAHCIIVIALFSESLLTSIPPRSELKRPCIRQQDLNEYGSNLETRASKKCKSPSTWVYPPLIAHKEPAKTTIIEALERIISDLKNGSIETFPELLDRHLIQRSPPIMLDQFP